MSATLVAPHPVNVESPSLSAHYLPPHCEPPPLDGYGTRMQILVAEESRPVVSISSPKSAAPLGTAQEDRVVITLDAGLVGGSAVHLGVQETCDPYLYSLGHSLRCGFRFGTPPPPEYLESLAPPIAMHLRTNYPVRMRKRERQGLSPVRLARVLSLIEERSAGSLSVEELAQSVYLSPFHFTRMFRRSTGLAPHAYITMRRLERAKQLLATTDQLMAEIARVVGYKNQAHFTRVFHANVGVTPRHFRSKSRGGR